MVQAERKPLVELRELAPQDFVRVFGETYDLVDLDALSIRQRAVIAAHFERLVALEQLGTESTDDDEREYAKRLGELLPLIVPTLPDAVLARIPSGKRAEIAGAFFVWADARSPLRRLTERMNSESISPVSPSATAPVSGS